MDYNGGYVISRHRSLAPMTSEVEIELRKVTAKFGVNYDELCISDNTHCVEWINCFMCHFKVYFSLKNVISQSISPKYRQVGGEYLFSGLAKKVTIGKKSTIFVLS